MAEVYALQCPDTGKIRYIGSTAHDSRSRYRTHISDKAAIKVREWVSSLNGKLPILSILLSGIHLEFAREYELELINKFPELLNSVTEPRIRHADNARHANRDDSGFDWLMWWKSKVNPSDYPQITPPGLTRLHS